MEELIFDFNKLILHSQFKETIEEINKLDISLPDFSANVQIDPNIYNFPTNGELVTPIEEISKKKLDPNKGYNFLKNSKVTAYDESIFRFNSLEGTAFVTSHCLILVAEKDFIPINYLTFYFYTRSKEIVNKSKYIKFSIDPEMSSKKDYMLDKISFLEKASPPKSIVLIDGPLIGGDVYTYMIRAIEKFEKNEIIPIFFVKNSSSNMVTDNIEKLRGKYNSDLHWAYNYLKSGECTNFFYYRDKNNPQNAKVFTYLKVFNLSPQRIEMHYDTFKRYRQLIEKIMNMIFYLVIVQGHLNNPQVRPIAIAEIFARSMLKMVNLEKLLREVGLVPTMNQNRFGW